MKNTEYVAPQVEFVFTDADIFTKLSYEQEEENKWGLGGVPLLPLSEE